jgi:rare lipoprotein A
LPFDENKLTAASPWLPFGKRVRVTRTDTGASVIVVITDRGPAPRLGRGIDLSTAAARAIGMLREGIVRVKIEPGL